MTIAIEQENTKVKSLQILLNGIYTSIKNVFPINLTLKKPSLLGSSMHLSNGVLIGITGDIKGKIILSGKPDVFSTIAKSIFEMKVEGEMLSSFSGELGNMIAGSLSTLVDVGGINMDITTPTIMTGDTLLSGYEIAIQVVTLLENEEEISVYFLLD